MVDLNYRHDETHNDLLTEYGRNNVNTDVDDLSLDPYPEVAVLRDTALCDIHLAHDLDSGNK